MCPTVRIEQGSDGWFIPVRQIGPWLGPRLAKSALLALRLIAKSACTDNGNPVVPDLKLRMIDRATKMKI